jgi:fluoride exporter
MMLLKFLLIAAGGALGTLARYGTGTLVSHWIERHAFPYGTVAVNLVGCFLMGLAQGAFLERWNVPEAWRLAVVTGFLGGYTTFSAFGWETATLLREGQMVRAGVNLAISNVLGIALVVAGYAIARR